MNSAIHLNISVGEVCLPYLYPFSSCLSDLSNDVVVLLSYKTVSCKVTELLQNL